MRRLVTLLLTLTLITACNNGNKQNVEKSDKTQTNDRDSSYNGEEDTAGNDDKDKDKRSYTWAKKEQKKFLEDCKSGSEEQLTGQKLKDFCSCMLIQAQKYYPTYSQMDEKSNEDNDRKILASCAEYLDEGEND